MLYAYRVGTSETLRLENFNLLMYCMSIRNLNAQWIVGFTDGEGCFNLDVHVKKDMKWGLQIQPEFTIVQHEIDIEVLYALKTYFNCGSVSKNRSDRNGIRYHYKVKSVHQRTENIVPFFEKHLLQTKKSKEFEVFKKICVLMHSNYHRNSLSNFLEIIDLGENLRVRANPKKQNSKRNNVNLIVSKLRIAV